MAFGPANRSGRFGNYWRNAEAHVVYTETCADLDCDLNSISLCFDVPQAVNTSLDIS